MLYTLLFSFAFSANNVILFIGDGMGPSVVSAGRVQYKELAWDQFSSSAFVMTKSNDNHVTDSAAAATALATGIKTDNYVLGLGPKQNDKRPNLETLTDIAKKKQMSVGLVTTTTVTHATPAAFYAHTESRKDDDTIANDLFATNIDLIFGGSTFYVEQKVAQSPKRFHILREKKDLVHTMPLPALGLFHMGEMPYYDEKEFNSNIHPRLSEMVSTAISILSKNKNGFFLMVEGGRIDHALHKNNIPLALVELSEFSEAVRISISDLKNKKLLDKTLLVVTADHDTAGVSINGYLDINKPLIKDRQIATSEVDNVPVLTSVAPKLKSSAAHTAVDVPLFARGPCSIEFRGLMDNTDVFDKIKGCAFK